MSELKVFIFDLDDTLYPEIEYVWSGFRAVSRMLADTEEMQDRIFNAMQELFKYDKKKVFDRFIEGLLLHPEKYPEELIQKISRLAPKDIINEMILCYRLHNPQISLYEEVSCILERLKAIGIRLGLITDGFWEAQKRKVKSLGLEKWMELILYTDELGSDRKYWKPSPYAFRKALDYYSVEAGNVCYIGDNPAKDFIGPSSLGIKTAWIRRFEGLYKETKPEEGFINVNYKIETLYDLLTLV
ncbi:HAD family hydrolase [Moorella naiadis]|uniref:HAD family hydrolase n=1 Tax=Moorella naiadis (nom. illeg.) TaxID=3093670 RepID=UPI003D9CA959